MNIKHIIAAIEERLLTWFGHLKRMQNDIQNPRMECRWQEEKEEQWME